MKKYLELIKYEFGISVLFILSHLPSLGIDNFNTDVWKWKKRIFDFSSGVFGLRPEETVQTYHPGVPLMWLGTIAIKFYNLSKDIFNNGQDYPDVREIFYLDFAQKFLVVLGIAVGVFFMLCALRKILGTKGVVVAGLLLMFEPFYLALTRVIHLEGLTSTYLVASLLWLYVWGQARKKLYLSISAILGVIAVLTKTSALIIVPFSFVYILLLTKHPKDILKWFAVFVVTALVMWPALLFKPMYVINYLYTGVTEVGIEEGHDQFYFGNYVTDPGWTFYFVSIAYRTSPAVFVLFIVSLLGLLRYKSESRKFIFYILAFILLYLVEITLPTKKLDRYMLPILIAMVVCSSVFLNYVMEAFKHRYVWVISLLAIVSSLFYSVTSHPIYLNYYSPLFGGLGAGIHVIEPKWLIGTNEIISYFRDVKSKEGLSDFKQGENIENLLYSPLLASKLTVAFPEKYYTQIHPFFRLINSWAVIEDLSGQAVKTKFFVYPVWDDYSNRETRFKLEYYGDISIGEVPVYKVYKRVI